MITYHALVNNFSRMDESFKWLEIQAENLSDALRQYIRMDGYIDGDDDSDGGSETVNELFTRFEAEVQEIMIDIESYPPSDKWVVWLLPLDESTVVIGLDKNACSRAYIDSRIGQNN